MTENTSKKPRSKRRTKAQIEAEKAAKPVVEQEEERCIPCEEEASKALEAAEAAIEIDEILEQDGGVHLEEAAVEETEPPAHKPETLPGYIPKTGLAKLRQKLSQRKLRDSYYEESKKRK